jgi:GT2 family glycosyltransferase
MLPYVIDCSSVGEVIIIDNNSKERPNDEILRSDKITLVDEGRNLYFNPSINLGASLAKFDILCILNDDVVFDPVIFKVVDDNYDKDKIGLIYPHPDYFNRAEEHPELIKNLKLIQATKTLDGFGCCMFIHKENFIQIPNEFVHHFGDEFQHRIQIKNKKTNYYLYNWVVLTPMRVTTRLVPEVQEVIARDWQISESVFKKYGIE